jgi:hypothetical protein
MNPHQPQKLTPGLVVSVRPPTGHQTPRRIIEGCQIRHIPFKEFGSQKVNLINPQLLHLSISILVEQNWKFLFKLSFRSESPDGRY